MSEQEKDSFLRSIRSFVTYEEVYRGSIQLEGIIKLIKLIPIERWIRIASMGLMLLDHYESEIKYQGVLLDAFFPKNFLERKIETDGEAERVLFHRVQFLALFRLSLLHGQSFDGKDMDDNEGRELVARCLLGISSLIYKMDYNIDSKRLYYKLSFDVRGTVSEDEKKFIMGLLQVYYNHLRENMGYIVGRYKDMIFDIPSEGNFEPKDVNKHLLDDIIKDELHISKEEYASLAFGITAKYISPKGIFKKEFHFPIDRDKHFSNTTINEEIASKFLNAISQSQSEFIGNESEKGDYESSIIDFTGFMLKPLIHLDSSNECYPVSLVYLQRLLESGFIWTISGGKYRNDLRHYWGRLFEYYCTKICERIGKYSMIKPKFFPEQEYYSQGNLRKSCDALFIYGDKAILLEFKTKYLRIYETLINRSYESFLYDINQAFIRSEDGDKAAAQIDETIRAIRRGDLVLPGISPFSIRIYYPVIVTQQAWPLNLFVYELIRREVSRSNLLNRGHIAKLEIWSVEELEYIEAILTTEAIRHRDMPQLLNLKLTGKYESRPMSLLLADLYSNNFPHNTYLHKKREEMFEIVTSTLKLQV